MFSFKLMNGDTIPDIEHLLLMTLLLQHFGTLEIFIDVRVAGTPLF